MSNRTRASIVDNDAILQRLDHEHLAALQRFTTLFDADGEAEVESARRRKPPTASSTPSASPQRLFRQHRSTLDFKTKILARQGRALTAGEMLFKEGEVLQRLGVSVLADALAIFGTDYDAEPDSEAASEKPMTLTAAGACKAPAPPCFSSDKVQRCLP